MKTKSSFDRPDYTFTPVHSVHRREVYRDFAGPTTIRFRNVITGQITATKTRWFWW